MTDLTTDPPVAPALSTDPPAPPPPVALEFQATVPEASRVPAEVVVDMNTFTIRDVKAIEGQLGRKLGDMFGGGLADMDADTTAGVLWVTVRRTIPDFTMDEAYDIPMARVREEVAPLAAASGSSSPA